VNARYVHCVYALMSIPLIWRRAAKRDELINEPTLDRSFLQIWACSHECADVFGKLFRREPAACYAL